MPDTGRPPTPERKKPLKYPAEGASATGCVRPSSCSALTSSCSLDFLCSLTAKEIREGKPVKRPMPHRDLPFGARFEQLVLTWNFLNSFGSVQSV